jgi:predicted component of type VI protein secretion system
LVKENGVPEDEDNFDEALKAVNTSLSTTGVRNIVTKSSGLKFDATFLSMKYSEQGRLILILINKNKKQYKSA